jgi:hypothetical protein
VTNNNDNGSKKKIRFSNFFSKAISVVEKVRICFGLYKMKHLERPEKFSLADMINKGQERLKAIK